MRFAINQVYCEVETGCRYWSALRHGSSPTSTLVFPIRAGEGLIACESLEDEQYFLRLSCHKADNSFRSVRLRFAL